MKALLLTAGDPTARTGGSLYHRRIADRAPRLGLEVAIRAVTGPVDLRSIAAEADVVIVDSIVASRVRPAGSVPVVASVHQRPGGLAGSPAGRIARAALDLRCYRRADAVVVPSPYLGDALVRFGVRASRVRVVEPGCDPRSEAATATRDDDPSRGVTFVGVANLSPHKRPLELIEAFAALSDMDVSLLLVGGSSDAGLTARVERRLRRPDVAGRVRWLGSCDPDTVATVVRAADVFVSPARHESYGMAVAEALAVGLPAIVVRSGNLPNLVRDGVDGYVTPPGDVGALAAAMRRLATDPGRRRAMAAAAIGGAERFPTWDVAAARFLAIVRTVQPPAEAVPSFPRSAT